MNCIIVDDEPLAREAMKLLIEEAEWGQEWCLTAMFS